MWIKKNRSLERREEEEEDDDDFKKEKLTITQPWKSSREQPTRIWLNRGLNLQAICELIDKKLKSMLLASLF